VAVLELMNNKLTHLGCEFIGRILHPDINVPLQVLKLDHNSFGAAGVAELAKGMALNRSVASLSLTYCDLDAAAAKPLFEILIY